MQFIGVDTEIIPFEEARIHPLDVGLHRGYAIFDYFPIRKGVPWFLEDYLKRFTLSARAMSIPLLYKPRELSDHLQALVAQEEIVHGGCKLLLTAGGSEDGYTPRRPTLYTYAFGMKASPEAAEASANQHLAGPAVRVNLLEYARPHPSVKTTNYSAALQLQDRQVHTNAAELVYHFNGYISEASRSNVFCVNKDGHVIIPPTDTALKGITSKHMVIAARKAGITVLERSLGLQEFVDATEVGITSSSKLVRAVGQVEQTLIGNGEVGPITARLAELLVERGLGKAGFL